MKIIAFLRSPMMTNIFLAVIISILSLSLYFSKDYENGSIRLTDGVSVISE